MKISSIKTEDQFYEVADVWYQRTHKLRLIWQNENETIENQIKAFKLWQLMEERVLKLKEIAVKLQIIMPKYSKGGIAIVGENNEPEQIDNYGCNTSRGKQNINQEDRFFDPK